MYFLHHKHAKDKAYLYKYTPYTSIMVIVKRREMLHKCLNSSNSNLHYVCITNVIRLIICKRIPKLKKKKAMIKNVKTSKNFITITFYGTFIYFVL